MSGFARALDEIAKKGGFGREAKEAKEEKEPEVSETPKTSKADDTDPQSDEAMPAHSPEHSRGAEEGSEVNEADKDT